MTLTERSTTVTLIEDASQAELRSMQETSRDNYIRACERSSDARTPSTEDLEYWWPLTVRSNVA